MPIAAELYYHAYESGEIDSPAVILIHGAGGNCLYWPAEMRRLPQKRTYAPDLPGHGKSVGRGQQSITSYAHLLIEWMNTMSISKAVVIGHSMGSAIGMVLALHYPERVKGLGLLGAGPRLGVNPEILAHSANSTTYHKAVDGLISLAFSHAADPNLVELAKKRMLEIRPSVLQGDLLACDTFEFNEQLELISQPTLVVCGEDDKLTPVRYSQTLARTIPDTRLEIIPQAGHMVMLEKPDEVSRIISDFISQISSF
jgi:pimeloyl-ACP methyl ester carboxylesterase